MTAIQWDQIGTRGYQAGIDRGVLYLADGTAVPWSGLVSVDENSNPDSESYYLDGVKFLDKLAPGEFTGALRAITYPREFERCEGVQTDGHGLFFHDQPAEMFSLTYRTLLGDDVNSLALGYRLHILYNMLAIPDTKSYTTLSDQPSAMEFGWTLTATPMGIAGYRPTTHISVKSTEIDPVLLTLIEGILYGTATEVPYLPSPTDLLYLIANRHSVLIHDNGDGTWTATGPDDLIEMLDPTLFRIEGTGATFIDPVTYSIPTTDG